jgi:GNAT superfamily N-acetyltransferase
VVATVGWRPLGPETLELERLYVHHRWRRQGVAAGLADMVEHLAADRGATEIELWSDSRFTDAHRFYQRRGYSRVGPDRELGDLSRTREHHFVKALRAGEGG